MSLDRWLVAEGGTVPVEVAAGRAARRRGLLGRDGLEGALLLPRTSSVHTFGMRFPIDVALLDGTNRVVRIATLRPNRLTRPAIGVRAVLEAEAGALARWRIAVGDQLVFDLPLLARRLSRARAGDS